MKIISAKELRISPLKKHLTKHKHYYLFGVFGSFAIVKLILLLIGFIGTIQTSTTFAAIGELNSGNILTYCSTGDTTCDLSSQGITSIATNAFINHTNLQYLYIYNNSISSIESGDFNGLSSLGYLYFTNNPLTAIESGDFNGLPNLETLNLNDNQIANLESGAFYGLSNLEYLYLSNNQLSSLESYFFNGLSSTKTLYLNENQITSIESGAFHGLSSLQQLYLHDNQISSIENGDFYGLSNLQQTITLYNNQIASIESGDFNGLSNLLDLGIYNNQITSIESGDFYGLPNLQGLGIQGNQISSIESGAFNGLSNLTELNLTWNQIPSIESGDFNGLPNLIELHIAQNQISSIESNSFNGLSNLSKLNLGYNQITGVGTGVLYGLSGLQQLYLGSNQISSIENGNFSGLSTLNVLYLNDNLMVYLPDDFIGLTGLTDGQLRVNNNYLQVCEFSSGLIAFIDQKANDPNREDTQTNTCPVCGNSVVETGEVCDDGANNGMIGYCNATCDGYTPPFSCTGVTDVPVGECEDVVTLYYSTNGTGWNTQTNRLGSGDTSPTTLCDRYGISCSSNHISTINLSSNNLSGTVSSLSNTTGLQYLYLNSNTLTTIATGAFNGLSNLISINLNAINFSGLLPSLGYLPALQYFMISNNNLSSIAPDVFSGLSNLNYLFLNSNDLVYLPDNFTGLTNLFTGQLYINDNRLQTCEFSTGLITFIDQKANDPNWEDTQTNTCPVCGNGVVETGEVCDDGMYNGVPGYCNVTCDGAAPPFSCTGVTDVPVGECEDLVAIYSGTNGPSRTNNNNWLSSTTVCSSRYGVYCDGSNHVYYLPLGSNNLSGEFPSTPNLAANLQYLYLNNNHLTMMPEDFTGMTTIRDGGGLSIGNNYLQVCDFSTGLIAFIDQKTSEPNRETTQINTCPVCGNGTVETGEVCDDGANNGIPGYCNSTCDGTVPPFSCTGITDVSVAECEALVDLYNNTSGSSRSNQTNRLSIGDTTATTLADWYGITVSNEYTCCVPSGGSCPSDPTTDPNCSPRGMRCRGATPVQVTCTSGQQHIQTIDLQRNNLSGSIPASFGNISGLQNLYMNNNQISSLPTEIGNLSNLMYLSITDNQLTSLPAGIGGLTDLQYLYLYNNAITSLPAEIGNLSNLLGLAIFNNQLASLPTEIGNLSSLQDLNISYNLLTSLPETLIDLSGTLMSMDPTYNRIVTCALSPELISFVNNVYGNSSRQIYQISNPCPVCGNGTVETGEVCDDGRTVNGSPEHCNTMCDGLVPPFSCGDVTDVPVAECEALLDLYNATNGSGWISQTYRLGNLDATPTTICDWYGINCMSNHIYYMDLGRNNLSGDVPAGFCNLTGLQYLYLYDNSITSLPTEFGNFSNLERLYIYNNLLTTLPESLKDISSLTDIDPNTNKICTGGLSMQLLSFINDRYRGGSTWQDTQDTSACTFIDADGDGIENAYDNCFLVYNPGQENDDALTLTHVILDSGNPEYTFSNGATIYYDFGGGMSSVVSSGSSAEFSRDGSSWTTIWRFWDPQLKYIRDTSTHTVIDIYNAVFEGGLPGFIFDFGEGDLIGNACDCDDSICTTGTDTNGDLICDPIDPACPLTFCGDGIVQQPNSSGFNEECDSTDLNGKSCASFGYSQGTLSCSSSCTFITTNCSNAAGGGGGMSPLVKDNCPDGDYSPSLYDDDCGTPPAEEEEGEQEEAHYATSADEMDAAYAYAYSHGITTLPKTRARLDGLITRRELAKMISVFAKNVVGLMPDTGKICIFDDIQAESKEMKSFIQQACQLGLMGLHQDGVSVKSSFNPGQYVTRAEFGTVLSRLLYAGSYNISMFSKEPRYAKHLLVLKNTQVMNNITTPTAEELRGYVMIMLMRADENDLIDIRSQIEKVQDSGAEKRTIFEVIRELLPF